MARDHDTQGVTAGDELKEFVTNIYINAGLDCARKRNYEDAIAWLEEANGVCPNKFTPLIIQAKITFYQGKLIDCEGYLKRANDTTDVDHHKITILDNAISALLRRQERADVLKRHWHDIVGGCWATLSPVSLAKKTHIVLRVACRDLASCIGKILRHYRFLTYLLIGVLYIATGLRWFYLEDFDAFLELYSHYFQEIILRHIS